MKTKKRTTKFTDSQSGFTFVEIIIYLAIVGMVITSLVSFALSIAGQQNKNFVVQEVQANARVAMEIISQKIREASDVNVGTSVFGSNPGVLSLAMADGAKNPTIINLTGADGTLQIKEGANDPVALTSRKVKITNLVFRNLGHQNKKRIIAVDLTVAYDSDSGDIHFDYSQDLRTAVTVRK